jgi:hypothetical protein
MKLIEVTTRGGAQININVDRIAFVTRQPMESVYLVALPGARTPIDGLVTPYDELVEQLGDKFVTFDTPEGTVAYVNPEYVMITMSPELGTTGLMFLGGLKLMVKEGLTCVNQKLTTEE